MNDPVEITLNQLFSSDEYVIPVYQRNYAWGAIEINQLIQDIWDSIESIRSYYLGTLIIHTNRPDGKFETIDGQQRLTTLMLLVAVLKNEFPQSTLNKLKVNIDFDSRPHSKSSLVYLFEYGRNSSFEIANNFMMAYEIIYRKVRLLQKESGKQDITDFLIYLLQSVKLLRVAVPKDTELNHYFEIMNNRGEQLEKHEILKAYCLEKLKSSPKRYAFSKIWDACSHMEQYLQYGFDVNTRKKLFGQKWNDPLGSINEIVDAINESQEASKTETTDSNLLLSEIWNQPSAFLNTTEDSSSDLDGSNTFGTIINFPNFLLQVLRVSEALELEEMEPSNDVSLDDKQLLETFRIRLTTEGDVLEFAFKLFWCKFLFDKYVLKRELRTEQWSLSRLIKYNPKSVGYKNAFEDERDNQQLIQLLSMFHVSFPTMNYKNWLSAVLYYLYQEESPSSTDYIGFLESLSDKMFFGRFSSDPEPTYYRICFDDNFSVQNMTIDPDYLHCGTHVQNYIFNRLDYLIWKTVKIENKSDELGNFKKTFKIPKYFVFGFRSSVEHFFPQNPEHNASFDREIDHFGNLCLISRSKNSSLSNLLPSDKKVMDRYIDRMESLKQMLMMHYDQWNEDNFDDHEVKMIALLNNKIADR